MKLNLLYLKEKNKLNNLMNFRLVLRKIQIIQLNQKNENCIKPGMYQTTSLNINPK